MNANEPKEIMTASGEIMKQVGVMCLRDEHGVPGKSMALYVRAAPSELDSKTLTYPQEEKALDDLAAIFAEKFGKYINGCRRAGIPLDA